MVHSKFVYLSVHLSTKYSFDNSAYGVGSDTGYGGGAASNINYAVWSKH